MRKISAIWLVLLPSAIICITFRSRSEYGKGVLSQVSALVVLRVGRCSQAWQYELENVLANYGFKA
jgi:hypothetical protein